MSLFTPRELDLKIVQMVSDARVRYGIPEGCEAEVACAMAGLKVKYAPLALGTEGALVEGQVIVNRGTRWTPRAQFTIYHELFHHLLEEDGDIIEHYTELLRGDDEQYRSAIERCCNQGAAEFMMPQTRVREAIQAEGFSVDIIELIADRHGSSLIASSLQLAHCSPVDCFVVLCSNGSVPRARPRRTGLYVDYVGAPARRKYMLARYSPIRSDHVLAEAWKERRHLSGATYVPYRSGKYMPCHCEAKPIGPFVAGILSFEELVPQGQMSLPL
jgi:IrrE N-terminal-like domain